MTVTDEMVLAGAKALHEAWRSWATLGGQDGLWDDLHQNDRAAYLRDSRVALTAALSDQAGGWRFDLENMPSDGSYLMSNDRGQVCPVQSRDGHRIMQNMVGFADWEYGSKVTAWRPLPAPPPSSTAGESR